MDVLNLVLYMSFFGLLLGIVLAYSFRVYYRDKKMMIVSIIVSVIFLTNIVFLGDIREYVYVGGSPLLILGLGIFVVIVTSLLNIYLMREGKNGKENRFMD